MYSGARGSNRPFKPPSRLPDKPSAVPIPIGVPREGGRSEFDRDYSSPGHGNKQNNGRNGYQNNGGGHRSQGGNGSRSSSPHKKHHHSSSSSSQHSSQRNHPNSSTRGNWNGGGSEGFAFASATEAAYTEGAYDPLGRESKAPEKDYQVSDFGFDKTRSKFVKNWSKKGPEMIAQQTEKERKRKEAEEAAVERKRDEDKIKEKDLQIAERSQREDRERQEEKRRRLNSSSSSTKLASTSTSTSTASTSTKTVTSIYEAKHLNFPNLLDAAPAPDLSKSRDFLAQMEATNERKKQKKDSKEIVLSDDEEDDSFALGVVTLPVKEKRDKGKGKERERDEAKGKDAESSKKSGNLIGKFRKNDGFVSSPPKKTKMGNTIISSSSSSTKQKAPKPARQASPTLGEQFAQIQEAAEMDAEIARADEKAKREKERASKKLRKEEDGDSDIEVVESTEEGTKEKGKGKAKEPEVDVLAHLEEFRKKKLLAMPQREKTPDELLDTQHVEIDPSTLCPFCDSLLPTHPSARLTSLKDYLLSRPHIEPRTSIRNRKAKYLPIVQIASFCQLHKIETTLIPEGRKKGYPMHIDWDGLPGRIETSIAPRLSNVILGEAPSSLLDRAKRDWEKNGGFKRTGVTAEWDSFHFEEPGYYGPRGFELIHSTLRQLFTVDQPLLTPSNIGELSSDYYLRRVLVPETALDLIRLDLKLDRSTESMAKATKVLGESRAFGKAAHGIVEDLKKEHASAKEEERMKQQRKEQERIDKIKREKQEREAEERRELEEEEARLAAELAAAPQFRKPKALAQLSQPKSSNPSTSAPASSASNASSSSTKKRLRSPDLNDLADLDEEPAVKSKSKAKTQPTLGGGGGSITSQLSVLAFLSRTGLTKEDLGKDSTKPSASTSSSTKEKSKKEGKQPIILDSSSDSDDLEITSTAKKEKKKLKRRASSPEKRKRSSSPDKIKSKEKEKEKRRRASSPTGSPKKKSKSSSSTVPITDQTNSLSARSKLRDALASSDLEEEIETNFKEKNLKAKARKTKEKRSTAAKKAIQRKKDEKKGDKYKGDADSSDSD